MDLPQRPGFPRAALRARYDVGFFSEDKWHSHSGKITHDIIRETLEETDPVQGRLLNAGSGVYKLTDDCKWSEYCSDLFHTPLIGGRRSICSNVEALPFQNDVFDCVVCVGEVLGYCDPARALSEFARVLTRDGVLIVDFGNSKSSRYRFTQTFGRAADIATDRYNDTPEKIWVYSPEYISALIAELDFDLYKTFGTHFLSAMGRKAGIPDLFSLNVEKVLGHYISIASMCDVVTFIAVRGGSSRSKL